jgi:hypothetical protein
MGEEKEEKCGGEVAQEEEVGEEELGLVMHALQLQVLLTVPGRAAYDSGMFRSLGFLSVGSFAHDV